MDYLKTHSGFISLLGQSLSDQAALLLSYLLYGYSFDLIKVRLDTPDLSPLIAELLSESYYLRKELDEEDSDIRFRDKWIGLRALRDY